MWEECLDGVGKLSQQYGEAIWRVSEGCLDGCLEGVGRLSRGCGNAV